ncbi:MAG: aquaporin [Chloroflexi bacterium]|nr:aquaporin [Chloroflexota bacterium]
MAAITPRVRWGSREVDWTWVPESSSEIASVGRRMFGEALGMVAFTFVAGSALVINRITDGQLGLLGMAVAIALAYAIIVLALYPVSGGHINPAVTLGQVAARRMPPSIAVLYMAAQAGGAIVGALLLELIFRDFLDGVSRAASLSFAGEMDSWTGGFLEAILTFLLVTAYFRAFVDPKGDARQGPMALGLVVLVSFLVAFPLTGAALNVTRVFGTDLVAGHWSDFFAYWIGLIGGLVAGLVYQRLFAGGEEEATT